MQRKMGKYDDDEFGETWERQCTPQKRFWRKEGEFNLSGWGTGKASLPGCHLNWGLKDEHVDGENRTKSWGPQHVQGGRGAAHL